MQQRFHTAREVVSIHRQYSCVDRARRGAGNDGKGVFLGVAEYFLRRKVRSVLDIGAGEGAWRAELRRLRPSIRYTGVDPSEYVVRRHGRRRNIRLAAAYQCRQ